jgi:phage tail sheath gpL-like
MFVQFNSIPANLCVPLFYAEINAGQSPYSGPSRLLLIGQKLAAGSAVLNTPIRLDGNEEGLLGAGSMLAEMAIWARQNHPSGQIWMLPIDDPSGVNQTFTVTVASGIAGKTGTAVLYVACERIEVTVAPTDEEADVAANLAVTIRPLSFPVTASVATNVVTLTARHKGTLGAKISIEKNLVGDEGPLQQYLTIASGTAGTGVPALGTALAALGDQEYDWIAAPYADTTSLDTIKDFLGATSGRWSPMQQLYGHDVTALFDTMSNLAAAGAARNDPNVSIMGVANSPSPPWRWAAAVAPGLRWIRTSAERSIKPIGSACRCRHLSSSASGRRNRGPTGSRSPSATSSIRTASPASASWSTGRFCSVVW